VRSPRFGCTSRRRGRDADHLHPAEFGAYTSSEVEKWGRVVKLSGIKPH
jgi:hypothetical protein